MPKMQFPVVGPEEAMKTELRPALHSVIYGANVVEIWHDGKMIGTIYGADGPGVRILTKHSVTAEVLCDSISVALVKIQETTKP